jgi:3-hydroxybutyryl-CoA dehydrogenase
MRFCVLCDDDSWKDLFGDLPVTLLHPADPVQASKDDILFDLRDEAWDLERYNHYEQPVFIAGVIGTLKNKLAPEHLVRINSWPGMLARPAIEAVAAVSIQSKATTIFERIHKRVEWVSDLVGMVSPRVISMIINEACLSWEERVSNQASIDLAMKLGTNYPLGPFEWASKIGWDRIRALQQALAAESNMYTPAKTLLS